jgi:hypothetical protein
VTPKIECNDGCTALMQHLAHESSAALAAVTVIINYKSHPERFLKCNDST